jgi:hypothetical protein
MGNIACNWAVAPQPPGSTTLYREYGTTTPGNNNSGTEDWFTSAHGPAQPGLALARPSVIIWVFTSQAAASQAAAGPGSTHVCEALVNPTFMGASTGYYQLFAYPHGGCLLDFWT